MSRPRVLFLCQVLPYPLDAGPKRRAYHVLRWMAERVDLHLVCFLRPEDPPEAVDVLRSYCAAVTTVPLARSRGADVLALAEALLTGRSFILLRDERRDMRSALAAICRAERFDAVHADQLWMAGYAVELPLPYKVLDEHNAVFLVFERLALHERSPFKRWLWRREARRIAPAERALLADFDHTIFVSEIDRRAVDTGGEASSVMPICVDSAEIEAIRPRPDAHRITVLGTMFWPPNAEGVSWLAEHVFERILREVPDCVLTVIGKRPPAALRAALERFGDAVEITGYVSDPRPYLEQTAVFAVPLRSGGGMRVKILDAWAWRLPVLSTTMGAEGIRIQAGKDILIADRPADFARAAVQLLGDPGLRADIAEAGRRSLEAQYDCRRVYGHLGGVYAPILRSSP